jgi:hypothetical protein
VLRHRHMRSSLLFAAAALTGAGVTCAANHLDTPTVIMNPRADIGDLFTWVSTDGRRLNLAMTIVAHEFSPVLSYTFHVDSGVSFGATTASLAITCRFRAVDAIDCRGGDEDRAEGDPSSAEGLVSHRGRFRVYAGVRDDPFFNNVKGSRAAYDAAAAALARGVALDAAKCPRFDEATSRDILKQWRMTEGGAGKNFLDGWTPASLVISIDLDMIVKGGPMLAVWAATSARDRQLDRMGRPLTENALLATLGPDAVADELKERFNAATPAAGAQFAPELEKGLRLYDAFDGVCGNQLLAGRELTTRYSELARLLADDRVWVNSEAKVCTQFFAVELAYAAGQRELRTDCGGRTPGQDAVDVYRSLLVGGKTVGVDDGVPRDELEHSVTQFPFLAAPAAAHTTRDAVRQRGEVGNVP